jgi:hypothetical protein
MSAPVLKEDAESQAMARRMRDGHWAFADKVLEQGTVWFCWWNKARRHVAPYPADVVVTGLIDGLELLDWLKGHEDWWIIGEWDDARYAAPVQLTEIGRRALAERHLYDLEPVNWGLVEPGYTAVPAPVEAR